MIRTKDKILTEPNDFNTIIYDAASTDANRFVIGAGNKGIKTTHLNLGANRLMVVNADGILNPLELTSNKIIGTDDQGNIVLYDKIDIVGDVI